VQRGIIKQGGAQSFDYHNLGILLNMVGRPDEARLAFDRAFRPDPNIKASTVFIDAFSEEIEASLTALREEVRRRPENAGAWLRLGQESQVLGQNREANIAYREAIHLQPNDYLPYLRLVELKESSDEAKEAMEVSMLYRFQTSFPECPFVGGEWPRFR